MHGRQIVKLVVFGHEFDGTLEKSGRGSAWLERLVRDQEVGGSNPLAPTNLFNNYKQRPTRIECHDHESGWVIGWKGYIGF